MNTVTITIPNLSPAQAAGLTAQIDAWLRASTPPQVAPAAAEAATGRQDAADDGDRDAAARILRGLRIVPLSAPYTRILRAWYEGGRPEDGYLHIRDLARVAGISSDQARAMISKLSSRMRRIATPADLQALKTPLRLLVEVDYDESNSSLHRLTRAGRLAVAEYLGA
jgi:hypothetical protein